MTLVSALRDLLRPRAVAIYRSVGEAVQRDLERHLADGLIRPVVGRQVSFENLPTALEEMEQRRTTGRTIVMW